MLASFVFSRPLPARGGGLFFGAHYLLALVAALPALLLASLALVGVAYLVGSMVLLVRQSNALVDTLSYLFSIACGAAFPLTVLSGPAAVIPFLLPTTYALDVLRVDALHTRPLLPVPLEYALLSLLIVVLVPLGAWVFTRTYGKASFPRGQSRRRGSRTSRRASPTRLKARTAARMQRPGNVIRLGLL
jgi:hypothetical protein